jgi:hypothetical protein
MLNGGMVGFERPAWPSMFMTHHVDNCSPPRHCQARERSGRQSASVRELAGAKFHVMCWMRGDVAGLKSGENLAPDRWRNVPGCHVYVDLSKCPSPVSTTRWSSGCNQGGSPGTLLDLPFVRPTFIVQLYRIRHGVEELFILMSWREFHNSLLGLVLGLAPRQSFAGNRREFRTKAAGPEKLTT